jgi:hypothetical protein
MRLKSSGRIVLTGRTFPPLDPCGLSHILQPRRPAVGWHSGMTEAACWRKLIGQMQEACNLQPLWNWVWITGYL